MFNNISPEIEAQMRRLEEIDSRDRQDGTPRIRRLRQIPPETGRFIALMAAAAPPGKWIEIGTSAGYSTLYLALACRERDAKITTFEVLEEKVRLARETVKLAGVGDVVELIDGDARHHLQHFDDIAYCFLDAEKEIYLECYELVIAGMVKGGILLADNVISHREELQPMIDRAEADERVDSLIVTIGKGILMARKK